MPLDRVSLFKLSGLPEPFGAVLLVLCLILLLVPYFSGSDFGIFKIPIVRNETRKVLKIVGPMLLLPCVFLFLPIFPTNQQGSAVISSPRPNDVVSQPSPENNQSPLVTSTPGKTGITLNWNGANTVSWYLYDESGQKPLSPHGPFRWYCDPAKSDTEDVAPGDYVVKLQPDVDIPIEWSTFSPIKLSVKNGNTTQITPAVGRITMQWNGANIVSWYLYDQSGQKPLSPHGAFRWYCDPGKSFTQDLYPGEYVVKLDVIGYQPIGVTIKPDQETKIVRP